MSYFKYWGKTSGDNIHLLPYHCLDVSAFSRSLLEKNNHWLDCLSRLMESGNTNDILNIVSLLSSLHDIGKFYYNFQLKRRDVVQVLSPNKPNEKVVSWDGNHVAYGYYYLYKYKELLSNDLSDYFEATAFHHGKPIKSPHIKVPKRVDSSFNNDDCEEFIKYLVNKFPITSSFKPSSYSSWIISGIVIIADWLGSAHTSWNKQEEDLDTYYSSSLERSRKIVNDIFVPLSLCELTPSSFSFSDFNDLQKQVIGIDDSLALIESNTGSGKTEAALRLAQNWVSDGCSKIIYALPTMATTNAMYDRITKIKDYFGVEPILSHSKSKYLDFDVKSDNSIFFRDNRKKSLLSNFSVVTIDQLILGLLPSKHNSLRLLGLVDSVIIIDEIHCYDQYVVNFIKELLDISNLFNIRVIMLSATMPKISKEELRLSSDKDEYPLITTPSQTMVVESSHRDVDFKVLTNESEVVEKLQSFKGSSCWIRNTVSDARNAYDLMKDKHKNLICLHSRFALIHRLEKEKKIMGALGKNSSDDEGLLVIATQVVEQSLDIAFKNMISDLSPADSFIQRLGRLLRFSKLNKCLIYVHAPEYTSDIDSWGGGWRKTFLIYDKYLLYRTLEYIVKNRKFNTKNNVREFIDYCYDLKYREEFEKYLDNVERKKVEKDYLSNRRKLRLEEFYQWSASNIGWGEDDVYPTRLSEIETKDVIMCDKNKKPLFGNELESGIRIPSYYLSDAELFDDNKLVFSENGEHHECVSKKALIYSLDRGLFNGKI